MHCFELKKRLKNPHQHQYFRLALVLTLLANSALHAQTAAPLAVSPPASKTAPAFVNSLGMKFREVPGTPVLFCIWETRVKDFAVFLERFKYEWNSRPHFSQTPDDPVVNTTLRDAMIFCDWLTKTERAAGLITGLQTYRLPKKEEWDAAVGISAARNKGDVALEQKMRDQQTFPWGTEWPPPPGAGNFNSMEINGTDDHYTYTAPVGQFKPSPDGLYDLAGNVWEWTLEPESRQEATLRGGSWMYFRKECLLSAYEYRVPVETRASSIGFRVVLEDKQRLIAFVAAQKKTIDASEKELRDKMSARPHVNEDEVAKMRALLAANHGSSAAQPLLPDPAILKPAQKGLPFLNALGMSFQPLGETNLLMGAQEVRVQDYETWLKTKRTTWEHKPSFDIKPTHPIVNVTWQEARDFCQWLTEKDRAAKLISAHDTYHLPTDEEWSIAVGLAHEDGDSPATKHLKNKLDYPWGREMVPPRGSANIDTSRLSSPDEYSYTAPVGSFSPNAFHIYDLAGNAAEWCEDAWPSAPAERVVRGSSWLTIAPGAQAQSSLQDALLSSYRQHVPATTMRPDLGFRVILRLDEAAPK